jgi:hypothetical protein
LANELGSDFYYFRKSLIKLKISIQTPKASCNVNGKNIVPDVYDVKERYNPFE